MKLYFLLIIHCQGVNSVAIVLATESDTIPANTAKVTYMIKTAMTRLRNMLSKVEVLIKGYSQIPR